MIRVKGLNQIPRVQSNSIQIQVQTCFLIFIWNPLTFGQSVEYKSCSKCPNLLPDFSHFFEESMYFLGFIFASMLFENQIKKSKTFLSFTGRTSQTDPLSQPTP
jgi:hypothetical protein